MMRGRQIGSWISQRGSADAAPVDNASAKVGQEQNRLRRLAPFALLIILIVAVGWWVRREGGYRRFITSLRAGKVESIEFQPYPNSPFVKISEEKRLAGVADW